MKTMKVKLKTLICYRYEAKYLDIKDSDNNGEVFGKYERYKPKYVSEFSFRLGTDFANTFRLEGMTTEGRGWNVIVIVGFWLI